MKKVLCAILVFFSVFSVGCNKEEQAKFLSGDVPVDEVVEEIPDEIIYHWVQEVRPGDIITQEMVDENTYDAGIVGSAYGDIYRVTYTGKNDRGTVVLYFCEIYVTVEGLEVVYINRLIC